MFTDHIDFDVFEDPAVAELLDLMPALRLEYAQLELVPRRGWGIRKQWGECDFNGEHTRNVIWALRQLPADKLGIDVDLVIKLLFIHDFPEKMGFDITIFDECYPQKKELETQWCSDWVERLGPNGHIAGEYWNMYNDKKIPEAKFAGQMDKIDCLVHAKEKERKGFNIDDFIGNITGQMALPLMQWLCFNASKDRSKAEPYSVYNNLLHSYDKFELSHNRYMQSDVAKFVDYKRYLELFENPDTSPQSKLRTTLRPVVPPASIGKIVLYNA